MGDGQEFEAEAVGETADRHAKFHGLFGSGAQREDLEGGQADESSGAPSQAVSDEDVVFAPEERGSGEGTATTKAPWRKSRVRFEVSAETLDELYLKKKMTAREIAALHRVSPATVNARLREFGLTGRKRTGMRVGR